MKKIVFLIFVIFTMVPFFVNAESATLVSNRFDDLYTYYYDASLGRIRYLEASRYSFGGRTAYCLEIGKRIESLNYTVYNSFDNISINADDLEYIKIIAYYGYDYPGHKTDKFYMATQDIIWTRFIRTNISWVYSFDPDSFVYIEKEKDAIYDLYRKHFRKPSFDGKVIDVVLGEEVILYDDNDVLSMYKVQNKGVTIEGNELIIGKDYDGEDIVLKREKYTNNNFLLYTSLNSQKMMSVGDIDIPSSEVRVNLLEGSININKLDSATNSDVPMGEASLNGSVYGLYDSDNKLVDKFVIGSKEEISHLRVGKYYIKELEAGRGYLLDDNVYEVLISSDNLHISLTLYDKVIERKVDIFKVLDTSDTGIMTGEEGISFEIYDKNNNLFDTIVTDSDGYANITLPYGNYTFHQVNSTYGYYKVEDFKVFIDKYDDRPIYKLLSDGEVTSRVKVIKKDMDTLENIVSSNIKFRIFDVKNNCYVSFKVTYPEVMNIDVFELSSDGTFVTPASLSYGEYILYEVDDKMDGYVYNSDGIRFTIDSSSNFINDSDYGTILEIPFYNKRVKGNIVINKYGEDIVYTNGMYYYKDIYLDDVYFELYASSDIYENGNLIYNKDVLVGECITDDGGMCRYDNLPLGEYYLKEVKSNYDNVIENELYDINLEYKDQYTDVINYDIDVFNYLNKGKVIINKYESGSDIPLCNTLIEIRNMDDVIVYKGYTNSDGKIIIDDLKYGDYYISEVEASTGYRLLLDNIYFTLDKEEVNINIYNDRIEVPSTGINIGVINILSIITIVLFVFVMIIFWDNKKIMFVCVLFISVLSLYLFNYFYNYFGDKVKNNRAVNDFFDNKISDEYDERYRYTSVLEIPSIDLKRGIVSIDNVYNDVKYNIEFIKNDSDKFVFASHNGNYYYSYFDNLKDMSLGDDIYFYMDNRKYRFIYSESYVIKKDGYADIYCDSDKKCIALITCLDGNDNAQIVYIGYLDSSLPYEE